MHAHYAIRHLPPTSAEAPIVMHFVVNQNPDRQIQRSQELQNNKLVRNWILNII